MILFLSAFILVPVLVFAAPGDPAPNDFSNSDKVAVYLESFATTYENDPQIINLVMSNGYGTYDGWGFTGLAEVTNANAALLVGTYPEFECDRYCTNPGLYRNCNPSPAMSNSSACYSACMQNCQDSKGLCMYLSQGDSQPFEDIWGTQCCISNSTWQTLKANGDSCGFSYEETTTTSTTTTTTTTTTTSAPTPTPTTTGSGNFHSPSDCPNLPNGNYAMSACGHQFLTCSNGLAYVMNCPANLVYNWNTNQCDWPSNMGC
ncbi:hypothetical protein WR25_19299 [Diploscapter pachys]|uniref:Chitin-binding type-2 domain-containing protein n=1 Tax=Diploscapter pachys TaxID=2018661 RepID=A0A2A2JUT5_9BILA|nr:hypothetical protein WR25_19299 [Diploscapter pachys]